MEDTLSCNDKVLNEIYRYHDPPVKGVLRIPSLLWARISLDLKEYVVERRVDGKLTMHWYHRSFLEVATKRLNIELIVTWIIKSKYKICLGLFENIIVFLASFCRLLSLY